MNAIELKNLSKTFSFKVNKGLRGLFRPVKKEVKAVDHISLTIAQGETVAFIGPNGAGKSTTIKMLTGILQPSNGHVRVLGFDPLKQRRDLALRIGTVFGQRSQLVFNLPLTDSFELTAEMYGVPKDEAVTRIAALIEQFDLTSFVDQPVRKLSLGQRMRAEVANALIHNPDIIFLDEPTIGLDIVAKRSLRETIKRVNKERGTTVFLTSHDVGDIEEVCKRTMIVNHGKIVLDSRTEDLKKNYLKRKKICVIPADDTIRELSVGQVTAIREDGRLVFNVDVTKTPLKEFLRSLLQQTDIADLTIEDTPLEDIIHELYTKGS
jgi:ABC-2 type transport system ATP-binding protein